MAKGPVETPDNSLVPYALDEGIAGPARELDRGGFFRDVSTTTKPMYGTGKGSEQRAQCHHDARHRGGPVFERPRHFQRYSSFIVRLCHSLVVLPMESPGARLPF